MKKDFSYYIEKLNTYEEGYFLLSQFSIGFELEAIAPNEQTLNAFKQFSEQFFSGLSNVTIPSFLINKHFKNDASIQFNSEIGEISFEWRSPVFKVTPENISMIMKFLREGLKYFKINSSCGFHIHISMPEIFRHDLDYYWFLCNFALGNKDKELIDLVSKFKRHKNFNFENENFASTSMLLNIKERFDSTIRTMLPRSKEILLKELSNLFEDIKHSFFRIHPQGTLEWRGPRNFLDKDGLFLIKEFFIGMLIPLIRLINEFTEKKQIIYINPKNNKQTIISKEEFYNSINLNASPIYSKEEKFDLTQMEKQDFIDIFTNAPWLRKAEFTDAHITYDRSKQQIIFHKGSWLNGIWEYGIFRGIWHGGIFKNGEFQNGTWESGTFENGRMSDTDWSDGIFKNGYFVNSNWYDGDWYDGDWVDSYWEDGNIFVPELNKMVRSVIQPPEFFATKGWLDNEEDDDYIDDNEDDDYIDDNEEVR